MNRKQTKLEKLRDRLIEQTYYKHCSGVAINIMDIGKVFAFGHRLLADGTTADELGPKLRAFVDTLASKE